MTNGLKSREFYLANPSLLVLLIHFPRTALREKLSLLSKTKLDCMSRKAEPQDAEPHTFSHH